VGDKRPADWYPVDESGTEISFSLCVLANGY